MKCFALDVGDVWTGSAISDAAGFFARPYQTIRTTDLIPFLTELLNKEPITHIAVGHPKTLRGTSSDQTKKVETLFKELQNHFKTVTWILWDERLSSKQAQTLKHAKTKQEKIDSHSVAAAFILSTYLEFRALQANQESPS
ncbi:MAG: Holliday junction resolvase RuvX [Candidatus Babeliales bacterium]